jgi:hypothetical protein
MTCAHCPVAAVTTAPEPLCQAHAVAFFQALLVYVRQLPRRPSQTPRPRPVAARAA